MCAASGGSLERAKFWALDGSGDEFEVQYNPKELKVDKKVSWKEHDDQGQDEASLEFQKGSPQSLAMELMFDTTIDGTNVFETWVTGLLALTNANCEPESGEQGELDKQRPTRVLFYWGSFDFEGVVESISTSYTMFAADGTPLRAKVQVKMKEWGQETFDDATSGQRWAGNTFKLVEAKAGDTATSLANEYGADAKEIVNDNNIDDPMEDLGGTQVIVCV